MSTLAVPLGALPPSFSGAKAAWVAWAAPGGSSCFAALRPLNAVKSACVKIKGVVLSDQKEKRNFVTHGQIRFYLMLMFRFLDMLLFPMILCEGPSVCKVGSVLKLKSGSIEAISSS